MMKKKKLFLVLTIAVLFMMAGMATVAQAASNQGAVPNVRNHEFEEQKKWGNIAFGVCAAVVVGGVLFKVIAIISGISSGKKLGRARKKFKQHQADNPPAETPLEQEAKRHLEYMQSRRSKPK